MIIREIILKDDNFIAYIDKDKEYITLTRKDNDKCQIDLSKEFVNAIIKEWNIENK